MDYQRLDTLSRLFDPAVVAAWLNEVERHRQRTGRVTQAPAPVRERDERLLTVSEVSERLQVSRNAVYELARNPDFPAVRIGRSIRFSWPQVETWLADNGR